MRLGVFAGLAALFLLTHSRPAGAQSTAFTYQGRLTEGGAPATGTYDMRFSLFDSMDTPQGMPNTVTNSTVAVTAGLFTVSLDFGASGFPGSDRFLQIEVRHPGDLFYTTLTPKQPLTPGPYSIRSASTLVADDLAAGTHAAIYSFTSAMNAFTGSGAGLTNLNAGNLTTGTVPSGVVSGTYSNAVTLSNASNAFTGNGSGLTNINGSAVVSGTISEARIGMAAAMFSGRINALATTAGTEYGAAVAFSNATASESSVTVLSPNRACTAQSFTVRLTTTPGGGATRKFTLNDAIGNNTNLTCTVPNGSNTCSATGLTDVIASGSTLSIEVINTGSPAAASALFGWECR